MEAHQIKTFTTIPSKHPFLFFDAYVYRLLACSRMSGAAGPIGTVKVLSKMKNSAEASRLIDMAVNAGEVT